MRTAPAIPPLEKAIFTAASFVTAFGFLDQGHELAVLGGLLAAHAGQRPLKGFAH
jgi:hypothetical protein